MVRRDDSRHSRRVHSRFRRLREIEDRLETAEQRISRLENTLRGVVRETADVSVGGPCKCGESLLIVHQRTIYCPACQYRRQL